jgi:hypothetical protein
VGRERRTVFIHINVQTLAQHIAKYWDHHCNCLAEHYQGRAGFPLDKDRRELVYLIVHI